MTKQTKRRDLKIMWNSNGPWTQSGYGVELNWLIKRLRDDGWNQAVSCFYGLQGQPIEWEGIKMFPQMNNPWGSDSMYFHGQEWGADVIITLQDVWTLDPQFLSKIPHLLSWVPIDKSPAPPPTLQNLKYCYKVLSMSQFGKKELQEAGYSSTLILEGVDTNELRPVDKAQCKSDFKIPSDAFVFGMIAANKENPPRKGYQEAMEAFKLFHDKHPEAMLFFTTQQVSPQGFPIQGFAKYLGIADRCLMMGDYKAAMGLTREDINKQYNAFDVLLHPSQTEGFGLCIVEAQSCGVPVVIQNSQSMPELIIEGKTGWGAKTASKRFTNDLSWVNVADVQSVYETMEKAYKAVKEDREGTSKACRDWVKKEYDIDKLVRTSWVPMLEHLQEEILPPKSP